MLLTFMERAKSLSETITIQERLSRVQEQVEVIEGRISQLDKQSSHSMIQMQINESTVIAPTPSVPEWGTVEALEIAARAFVETVNFTIVLVGYLTPWSLIGLAGYVLLRRLRNRDGSIRSSSTT